MDRFDDGEVEEIESAEHLMERMETIDSTDPGNRIWIRDAEDRTVRLWAKKGRLPAFKDGPKIWRFRATDVEAVRRESAVEVREALEQLPGEQRRAIELAYFGGFTQSEIAMMLEVPIGAVKGRMRLGLEKMRERIGPSSAGALS